MSRSHQESLNNDNLRRQREIIPIDFDKILAKNQQVFPSLPSMLKYCTNVMTGLNKHLSIIMSGNDIGKLRIVQMRRDNEPAIDVISISKAKHLFTRCINIKWNNNGEIKKMKKNIIEFWLNSSKYRKEEYPHVQTEYRRSPLVKWLATHLHDPYKLSPVIFGQLNNRKTIYSSFEMFVNEVDGWNPKRISSEFYRMLPPSKPRKYHRVRQKGKSMIYIPDRTYCEKLLKQWTSSDVNLIF